MVTAVVEGSASTSAPTVSRRMARSVSWAIAVVVPALVATALTLHVHTGYTDLTSWWIGDVALGTVLLVPGLLVALNRPDNAIGWLLLWASLSTAVTAAGREYLVYGFLGSTAPGYLWIGWVTDSLWVTSMVVLPIMLMLFPDGQPMSRRARPLLALPITAIAIGLFGTLFDKGEVDIRGRTLRNPGQDLMPHALPELAMNVSLLLFLASVVTAIAVVIMRFRRSVGEVRQQMKWVVWAGTMCILELASEVLPINNVSQYTGSVASALLATAICIAILRHRLFDIDLVINRTLVFATLTVLVGGVYVAIVLVVAAALGESPRLGSGLLAAAFVAVAFAPARTRVQRGVDRLMYGERRNPYRVMTQLGRRLEDAGSDELGVVVETVTQALKLPYAAIVGPDGTSLAEWGTPTAPALSQPLTYQGTAMGHLLVQPRDRGGRFDGGEQRLLADLARQVGAAVHAVRLSADLQASRTRLVSAKEEERRRLRRDLHDGLGPKLAALGLKLDAAHAMVDTRPDASKEVLTNVREDIRTTIDDVRRLVYALRPPALDELGLVEALRECGARYEASGHAPEVTVRAPGDLPPLPAAVEVAAYWIANEAITNVVRHAGAKRCDVELTMDDALRLRIRDDGTGLPDGWRPGVGTSSMRERAAELGGTVNVGPGPAGTGTDVVAVIPL